MMKDISPQEVRERIQNRESFVVNITAAWCPDCTERQAPHFPGFVDKMEKRGIPVFNCTVQHEKLVFLSPDHQQLTEEFGGHGYPRTVLILEGEVEEASRVEVVDPLSLDMLADNFTGRVRSRG